MIRCRLVLAAAAALLVCACQGTFSLSLLSGTGTIALSTGSCSTWCVRDDSGRLVGLVDLPQEFRHDGLRIRYTAKPRGDLRAACTAGEIADVVSIARI